tara:strand:+ start:1907 stop:2317 length:411 start_codon:yes stop_codon:yes gene_type:complete
MYEYNAIVTRIIDGDTIDVNIQLGFDVVLYKQRIRLHGIDTPESRTRDKEEKVRGLISKAYVQEKCPVNSTIRLKSKDRGKFGRILGVIYELDSNISINQKMCEEGYAVPYTGGNKEELVKLHEANKQILIKKGIL